MGYVLTSDELDAWRRYEDRGDVLGYESLTASFTTSAEFVKGVLPPCFEPADRPEGLVTIERYWVYDEEDNLIRNSEESCTYVAVYAKFEGEVGPYTVTMFKERDMSAAAGRELGGEPVKIGDTNLLTDGRRAYGYCERMNTRIVEIDANLEEENLGPKTERINSFDIRASLTKDYTLTAPPYVIVMESPLAYTTIRQGTGTLRFTGTPYDPLDSIPVISVDDVRLVAGTIQGHKMRETRLDDADEDTYVRHHMGRMFDMSFIEPA